VSRAFFADIYFWVGFAGATGVGVPGVAGFDCAGADFSFCSTEAGPPCLMALIDSVIEVNIKRTAEIVVARDSVVAAPRGPNAAWLPCPPNAADISPALPLCKSTTMIRNRHTITWMMVTRIIISGETFLNLE